MESEAPKQLTQGGWFHEWYRRNGDKRFTFAFCELGARMVDATADSALTHGDGRTPNWPERAAKASITRSSPHARRQACPGAPAKNSQAAQGLALGAVVLAEEDHEEALQELATRAADAVVA